MTRHQTIGLLLASALSLGGCSTEPGTRESGGPGGVALGQPPGKGQQRRRDHHRVILPAKLKPLGTERQHHVPSARVRINLGTKQEVLDRTPGEVWIHVSRDDGKTWEAPKAVVLDGRSFRFNFAKDEEDTGEGRFGIRLVKSIKPPAPLAAGTRPERYIVVDRTPPQLTRFNLPPEKILGKGISPPVFSWIARDNSNDLKITLEYRVGDAEQWQPIADGVASHLGRFSWEEMPAVHAKDVHFRCTATDAAGNTAVSSPKESRVLDGIPPSIRLTGTRAVQTKTGEVTVPFDVRKVGPSKLQRVQAWVSNGSGWRMHKELPLASPAKLRFDTDGAFGVTLVAIDSSHNHSPIPAGSARPEMTVLVDRSAPTLDFDADFDPKKYYRQGDRIRLNWRAKDANLAVRPVALYYRTESKKLHPIGGPRGPRGKLEWALPDLQGQLVFAAVAKDKVGNETWQIWPTSDKPGKMKVENTWAYAAIRDARASADKKSIEIDYEVRDLGIAPLIKVELYWRSGTVRDWILSRDNYATRTGMFRLKAPPGTYDFYVRAVTRSRSEPVPQRKTKPKLEGFRFAPRVPTVVLVRYPGQKRGEVYPGGKEVAIEWRAPDAGPDVAFTIEFNDGKTWSTVKQGLQGVTKHSWKLPNRTIDRCKLRFQVTDRMHGRATYTIPGYFSVDAAPPETSKVLGPRLVNQGKLQLKVQLADRGRAGVGKVYVWYQPAPGEKWMRAGEVKVSDTFRAEVRYEFELSEEGTYRLHFTGEDRVGNLEPSPRPNQAPLYVVTLDQTPPRVTVKDTVKAGALRVGDTMQVVWSASEQHPAARGTTLLYSSDGGTNWIAFAQEQPASGQFAWKIPDVVDGKKVRLQVQVRDRAGNLGKGELPKELQIGTKTLDVVAIKPTRSASNSFSVSFRTNSIDPRAQLAWVRLWFTADGVNWSSGPRIDNPRGAVPIQLPRNGRYGLLIQAADTLRNIEPPPVRGSEAELTVEVDSTPPIVRLRGLEKGDLYHSQETYTVHWDKLIDNNLGVKPVRLFFREAKEGRWRDIAGPLPDTQSYVWKTPGAGRYRIKLVAQDQMGNKAEAISKHELVIAVKAPVVAIIGPKRVLKAERNVTVRFRVTSELNLPIEKVSLYWTLNDGMAWNQLTTFRISGQNIIHYKDGSYGLRYEGRDGTNGIYLVAYDRAGNHNAKPASGTSPMVTYVMDSQPPALTIQDTLGGKVFGPGEQVSVSWKVADGNLAKQPITIKLSADAGYTWPITVATKLANSGGFTFRLPRKPPISGRYYRVRIEVMDRVGHVGHGVTELFTIDAKPPTSRFISVPAHIDRSPFDLQVAVADQDGAGVKQLEVFEVKLDATGKPAGPWARRLIAPWKGERKLSFDLQDGRWGLLLVATDNKGNRQAIRGEGADGLPTASTPPQQRITVHVKGPKVELLTMTGGQTITGGKQHAIRWRTVDRGVEVTRVVLSFSTDGGRTYAPLPGGKALQNVGRFLWTPPIDKDYPKARIRVEVFNRYGQRGAASSTRNLYIDNGKPNVSGIEIEEEDDGQPEVKGWLQERGKPRQGNQKNPAGNPRKGDQKDQVVLRPDRPKPGGEFDRLFSTAVRHYMSGNYPSAERAVRAALEVHGTWGRAHYLQALILQQMNASRKRVTRTLQTALAFDDSLAEAYNDLGYIYFREKRYQLAASFFRRALAGKCVASVERNRARYHYNLGLALKAQRKPSALAAFQRAVASDGSFGEGWFYVALLADEQGNQAIARQALDRLTAIYAPGSAFHNWAKSKLEQYK